MIRAITFDAAGTLFAPAERVGVTYARVAESVGIRVDAVVVEAAFRRVFDAAPPLAFPGVAADELTAHERAWWKDVVRGALGDGAAPPALDACFEALFAHYATASAWRVFPDVVPALTAARTRGLRTGVASNFDGRLPGLLDQLGLSVAVDAVVWSTAVGATKPARALFDAAARALDTSTAELCHVGDDAEADVAGARAAGAHAVHLDRSGRTPGSLATLDRLLDALPVGQP
ncbi:MAG: HAD-IA family hydrolase [Candidatus Binatia bacterium]